MPSSAPKSSDVHAALAAIRSYYSCTGARCDCPYHSGDTRDSLEIVTKEDNSGQLKVSVGCFACSEKLGPTEAYRQFKSEIETHIPEALPYLWGAGGVPREENSAYFESLFQYIPKAKPETLDPSLYGLYLSSRCNGRWKPESFIQPHAPTVCYSSLYYDRNTEARCIALPYVKPNTLKPARGQRIFIERNADGSLSRGKFSKKFTKNENSSDFTDTGVLIGDKTSSQLFITEGFEDAALLCRWFNNQVLVWCCSAAQGMRYMERLPLNLDHYHNLQKIIIVADYGKVGIQAAESCGCNLTKEHTNLETTVVVCEPEVINYELIKKGYDFNELINKDTDEHIQEILNRRYAWNKVPPPIRDDQIDEIIEACPRIRNDKKLCEDRGKIIEASKVTCADAYAKQLETRPNSWHSTPGNECQFCPNRSFLESPSSILDVDESKIIRDNLFIVATGDYYRLDKRYSYKANSLNNVHYKDPACTWIDDNGKVKRREPDVVFKSRANDNRRVDNLTHQFHYSPIIENNGLRYVNKWRPTKYCMVPDMGHEAAAKQIQPCLDMWKWVFEDCFEEHVNRLAYWFQNPTSLIKTGILVQSDQRLGKTWGMMPIGFLVGVDPENGGYAIVNQGDLMGDYSPYAPCPFKILEEVDLSRGDTYDASKELVTNPWLRYHVKFMDPVNVVNTGMAYLFTNADEPLPNIFQDQRWHVVKNSKTVAQMEAEKKKPDGIYANFAAWFGIDEKADLTEAGLHPNEDSMNALLTYLLTKDVSDYNPHATPRKTSGKAEIVIEGTNDPVKMALNQALSDGQWPYSTGLVSSKDVGRYLEILERKRFIDKAPSAQQLGGLLRSQGLVKIGRVSLQDAYSSEERKTMAITKSLCVYNQQTLWAVPTELAEYCWLRMEDPGEDVAYNPTLGNDIEPWSNTDNKNDDAWLTMKLSWHWYARVKALWYRLDEHLTEEGSGTPGRKALSEFYWRGDWVSRMRPNEDPPFLYTGTWTQPQGFQIPLFGDQTRSLTEYKAAQDAAKEKHNEQD